MVKRQRRVSSTPWLSYISYGLLSVIAAFVISNMILPPIQEENRQAHHMMPIVTDDSTKYNGIPTYEQYIQLSIEKKWSPVDPLDKLMTTCRKYSQVFDATDALKTKEFVRMLDTETQFLLSVLKKSSHRPTDLTGVFFEALEGVHRSLFHVQKQILQTNRNRVVSRMEAEHYSKSILYGLLTTLLRVTIETKDGGSTLESSGSPIYPHLTIDLNRPSGRDGSSALATAVGLRLFRLYGPLVAAGASVEGAVEQAIINRDFFSLELLLNMTTDSTGVNAIHVQPDHLTLACHTGDRSILRLLRKQLSLADTSNKCASTTGEEPPSPHPATGGETAAPSESGGLWDEDWSMSGKGFLDMGLLPPVLSEASLGNVSEWPGLTRKCELDVIEHATELSPDEFVQKYVRLRRPVVLRGLIDPRIQSGVWSYDRLLELGSTVRVSPQLIPYGDQMGQSKPAQATITSYLQQMRRFSVNLQKWLSSHLSTGNSKGFRLDRYGGLSYSDSTGAIVVLNVSAPLYVFDNEVLSPRRRLSSVLSDPFETAVNTETGRGTGEDSGFDSVAHNQEGSALEALISATHRSIQRGSASRQKSVNAVTRQFFAGPPLSGAPFHSHSHAFNACMQGRKMWLLLPPGHDLYSNIPPIQWSEMLESAATDDERRALYPHYRSVAEGEDDENVAPCHIEQRAGEVLFVPSMWTHQILNLAESVGFATEVHY